jgi:hypothetical protein
MEAISLATLSSLLVGLDGVEPSQVKKARHVDAFNESRYYSLNDSVVDPFARDQK